MKINSKMIESETKALFKVKGNGQDHSQSHCSQKSRERYSSNKKKGWAGVVAAASNIQQNTGQYPKCRLYNEFVDESSQSNQVSPDSRPGKKEALLNRVTVTHKMETFNKNDSSSGGEC